MPFQLEKTAHYSTLLASILNNINHAQALLRMVEDAFNFVKWLHEIQETKTEMIYFCDSMTNQSWYMILIMEIKLQKWLSQDGRGHSIM